VVSNNEAARMSTRKVSQNGGRIWEMTVNDIRIGAANLRNQARAKWGRGQRQPGADTGDGHAVNDVLGGTPIIAGNQNPEVN